MPDEQELHFATAVDQHRVRIVLEEIVGFPGLEVLHGPNLAPAAPAFKRVVRATRALRLRWCRSSAPPPARHRSSAESRGSCPRIESAEPARLRSPAFAHTRAHRRAG